MLNYISIFSPKLVSFQELGPDKAYISETVFTFIFFSFFLVRFYGPFLIDIQINFVLSINILVSLFLSFSLYRNMYPHMNST